MPLFELKLTQFLFPNNLSNNKANFRFVVDLRLIKGEGQFTTEHAVMPSLDTFWECDNGKSNKPNYVRHCEIISNGNVNYSQFDMNKIDDWDKLIFLVKGERLHAIQFKVFDVDRKDAWDKMQNIAGKLIDAFGKITDAIPGGQLGGAIPDLFSFLLKKIAGGDKVLFRGSTKIEDLDDENSVEKKIQGRGTDGEYQIDFSVTKVS